MPIDVKTPQSPGWWLHRCYRKLNDRLPRLEELNARYEGRGPLPSLPNGMPEAAKDFLRRTRLNLAELIVMAMLERIRLRSIRTAVSHGAKGDAIAEEIRRENDLDVEIADVIESMLVMGDGYTITGHDEKTTRPAITGEDPRQVVTIHDPVRQSRIRAAAKFYHDPELQEDVAYLYRPGRVWRASKPRKGGGKRVRFSAGTWAWDEDAGGAEGKPLPQQLADEVVVVRWRNRRGVGEFEFQRDVLDRIDYMILQRMQIATMQAFKQRAIKGDLPTHYPETHPMAGQEIDYDALFVADPGALWMLPGSADIWESGQADLSGILTAVKDDIRNLAAVARRPMSILHPENESAAGATLANDGLVFGTEDRLERAGRALAKTISLALLQLGETERAEVRGIEVDWMPVERHALTDRASASSQMKQAGLSKRMILEKAWQLSPTEVERELSAEWEDQLAVALNGDAQTPPSSVEVPSQITAVNGQPTQAALPPGEMDAKELELRTKIFAQLVLRGGEWESALQVAGLPDIEFTGAVPVALRQPQSEAEKLEG